MKSLREGRHKQRTKRWWSGWSQECGLRETAHTQKDVPNPFQSLPALAKARTCRASVGIMCRNRKGSQSS